MILVKYMKEVTAQVLANETDEMSENQRKDMIKSLGDSLIASRMVFTMWVFLGCN